MQYVVGDIWRFRDSSVSFVVVPTNTIRRADGHAVMGAGVAKDAADRYPDLPARLGEHIRENADALYIKRPIICFPTKHHWRSPSRLEWIEKGCHGLANLSVLLDDCGVQHTIYLPRLGCGLGGLDWERVVRPIVDSILDNDNFVCVSLEEDRHGTNSANSAD